MANMIFSEVEYKDNHVIITFFEECDYDVARLWEKATVEIPFSSICWKKPGKYKNHAIHRYKDCVHFLIEVDDKNAIVKYTDKELEDELYEIMTAPPF